MTTRKKIKKLTYCQIILNHMLAGKTMSNMESYAQYNMTWILQRISDLRAAGVIIQDKTVKQHGKRCKVYWIDKQSHNLSYKVIL